MKEFEKKVVELWQEMSAGQGLTDELLVKIFALLYVEPEDITMDELAQKTGYSLASVSNKIKILAPIMQVRVFKKPGSKKLYLHMEKNILKIWQDALLKKQKFVVNMAKERIPEIIKEFKGKEDRKKLEILQGYYEQMLKFEIVLEKIVKEMKKANG